MVGAIDYAFGALYLAISGLCAFGVWLVMASLPLPYLFTFILYMFLIGPLSYRLVAWLRAKAVSADRRSRWP